MFEPEEKKLTRQEKIAFCRDAIKQTNSNPTIKFEGMPERELDAWVRYFEYLIKHG